MNEQERKAWESLVEWSQGWTAWPGCAIRAVDAELKRLRSCLALAEKACQMALTVGTAYPSDTSARMDSHTEAMLRAAPKSTEGREGK